MKLSNTFHKTLEKDTNHKDKPFWELNLGDELEGISQAAALIVHHLGSSAGG